MNHMGKCVECVISIHALLAESDAHDPDKPVAVRISIHALLAESDILPDVWYKAENDFYPRSPCGERRYLPGTVCNAIKYFYPRSPCGERPCNHTNMHNRIGISIHALLAESDN